MNRARESHGGGGGGGPGTRDARCRRGAVGARARRLSENVIYHGPGRARIKNDSVTSIAALNFLD